MKMKKIGILATALVLCLAITGAAFAAWTDTLTINGTVDTGDVDVNVVSVSETWVYKYLPDDSVVVSPISITDPDYLYVASATAEITTDDNVTVTLDNLFPCVDFKVDFLIKYDGSIPAKLNIIDPVFTGANATFFNSLVWSLPIPDEPGGGSYLYGEMWKSDAAGTHGTNIPDLEGYQVHKGDYIVLVITLHLGQAAPMNASASFTSAIDVIQWNEYVAPG